MASRYMQVARTYGRWPIVLVALMFAGYFALLHFGYPPAMKAQRLTYLAMLTWLIAWASGTLAAHLKQQLADWRALVTPRFRGPHLLIGAAAMLVVAVIVPALAAQGLRFSVAGVVAMGVALAAATAWLIQLQNFAAGVIWQALWLSLLSRRVVFAVGAMLEWKNPALAVALIGLGGIALALLWARLARMHEGRPEVARRSLPAGLVGALAASPTSSSMTDTIDPWFESFLRRPIETRCIAAANLWARVRHLRATGLGRLPWAMGGVMAAAMLLVGAANQHAAGALEAFVVVVMILPPLLVFGHWARRWPALGYESLRPARRETFLREVGLAMGLDLAEAWIVVTIAALVPLIVWSPALLGELLAKGFFALSAATAVSIFAVNAWVLHLRRSPLTVVAMALTALAPLLPVVLIRSIGGPRVTLSLSLALLAIGALVTLDAFARWRRTDLG